MEGESILQTMAEVSVALAGFTGVVAAFGQRSQRWTPLDTIRFQMMLGTSLSALVFSILPIAIHYMGAAPDTTWAISSGLLAVSCVILPWLDLHRARRVDAFADPFFQPWMAVLPLGLASAAVVTQTLNAFDIGFHRTFGAYFLGVCCTLLISALMFIRLLSFVGQQVAEE